MSAVIVDMASALDQYRGIDRARASVGAHQPAPRQSARWRLGHRLRRGVLPIGRAQPDGGRQSPGHPRIGQVLRPGRMLVIHEYLAGAPLLPFHAAFRLTLLVETATRTYSFKEVAAGWTKRGSYRTTRIDLDPLEKGTLIIARR